MSSAAPTRRMILSLYGSTLRTSRSFSSYNFRNYFLRRTKDQFRALQAETDPEKVKNLYAEAVKELAVLRRSAIVNQLHGGWRLAVEDQNTEVLTRGDT
ncbi:complex 1 protein (lyr family) protein [Moniliophthora roreri MCA 2997]|uniref:Complex 1 protein (Lyr family) protein n=2 Tax=Moniliophthora roreri TaxID=221103 RepID=V2XEC2_MONRO|nr:complex 1 protein (lyr family) protein [Moniliophthora roreri MCA 2997]KAI3604703.1 complex 1 protein (lyr family) protein [Moniliophthora roreri]